MWQTKRFNELTVTDLYQILALRAQIFVVDQQRIYRILMFKIKKQSTFSIVVRMEMSLLMLEYS